MSIKHLVAAAALLLIPALAKAQTPTPTPTPTPAPAPAQEPAPRMTVGYLDFGVRGTTTNGDAARYERYRDLSDGLFLEVARLNAEKNGWALAFAGDHVGRKNQRLIGSADRQGKFGAYFMWDEITML